MATLEVLKDAYEMRNVVIAARDKMSAAKVQPFQAWQPFAEEPLYPAERFLQRIGVALAVAMAVEALNLRRQFVRQLVGGDAETASRRTWVVEQGLDATMLRVYPKSQARMLALRQGKGRKALILRQAIERYMAEIEAYEEQEDYEEAVAAWEEHVKSGVSYSSEAVHKEFGI